MADEAIVCAPAAQVDRTLFSLKSPPPELANQQLQPQAQAQVGLRYNVAVHP